jgi:hypothetical protein
MKKGRCATMTHDYKRNGTTTLFADLDVLDGKVIGRCMQRHRHQEFTRFLNVVETQVPKGKGNPRDPRQLRHPQASPGEGVAAAAPALPLPFTPTSCSWANAVEDFFAKLTRQRLKRGVSNRSSSFRLPSTVPRRTNEAPRPFVWTKSVDDILSAVKRGSQALESIHLITASHSMTSSARASSDCGTVRPSAFAVLRLMTSSKLVGCCIGKSVGLAPAKIRPT